MTLKWKHVPAEDITVDSEWLGIGTRIAIQDCRSYAGGYVVNEYEGEGETFAVTDHGTYKSLRAAKAKAQSMYEERSKS